jgi:hypothetical protein
MPIKISKQLRERLPENERADIEEWLRIKSNGVCFLCAQQLNEAAEKLVADHDDPAAEDGKTERNNLNLVHDRCNAFKKNNASIDVMSYLKFKAFLDSKGGLVKYGGTLEHFGVALAPCELTVDKKGETATFKFSDGSVRTAAVHTERNKKRKYASVFVDVPAVNLYNDDECQPRNIKLSQVWSIFLDLLINPLHEAPGCRQVQIGNGKMVQLLMFDGQHKTIASWLSGRDRIVVKIYLDLPKEGAIELVNSVQSRIKKLPLSPFELDVPPGNDGSRH